MNGIEFMNDFYIIFQVEWKYQIEKNGCINIDDVIVKDAIKYGFLIVEEKILT